MSGLVCICECVQVQLVPRDSYAHTTYVQALIIACLPNQNALFLLACLLVQVVVLAESLRRRLPQYHDLCARIMTNVTEGAKCGSMW